MRYIAAIGKEGKMKKKLIIIGGALVLVLLLSFLAVYCCWYKPRMRKAPDPLLKYCQLEGIMNAKQFTDFLAHLSKDRQLVVLQACVGDVWKYRDKDRITIDRMIKKELVWMSNHKTLYVFVDKGNIKYDEIVRWVAGELKITGTDLLPTFRIEHMIMANMFEKSWDKMTPEQREAALKKMEGGSKIKDIAKISKMSGSEALAALSKTVSFKGFEFYQGMSSFLSSAAAILEVTLPFATQTETTTTATAATLSGPEGWVLMAVGAGLGAYFMGKSDYQKTARIIIAIHLLKVEAVKKSGLDIKEFLEPEGGKS